MGSRTGTLVAIAAVALATSCTTTEEGVPLAAGAGGDLDAKITSADEVIKVVDRGFVAYYVETGGYKSDYLSYGYVIENVSDHVALSVRVEVDFTDKAGNHIEGTPGGNDFTVLLPGQQLGAGGNRGYDGNLPKDMDVRVTLIGSLDTRTASATGTRLPPTSS